MALIREPRQHRDGHWRILEFSDEGTVQHWLCGCINHHTTEEAWKCIADGKSERLAANAFGQYLHARNELNAMAQEAHALCVAMARCDVAIGRGPKERWDLWASALAKCQVLGERVARVMANEKVS